MISVMFWGELYHLASARVAAHVLHMHLLKLTPQCHCISHHFSITVIMVCHKTDNSFTDAELFNFDKYHYLPVQ